ncbi:uncharacterized protein EV422DRAFT_538992 [Fimicolochytrium jonesii]|uniref:uncharacterized protein n=1 Tax=Fimicolochytrium jonesii TaxID=1396493 RepID=UPI0022FE4282|nr:uncharacterized protein EV422DRAFT_538992 [Fimicolochytrium jonesii]KAI8818187.1 hypothetical protein EV422DRAFT_538992 [Fimicolochytrium jonesii]
MLIKSFSVRSLTRNLAVGNGSQTKLPTLQTIAVTFGNDACPAKGGLSSLYVNELPRLHAANPHITFTTAEEEADHCSIELMSSGKDPVTLDLRQCTSAGSMYKRILVEVGEPVA